MITKFDSSYYGTADMENLGYNGTPINDRCYSKEELAKAMHKVVAYAKCMDERGYDTFWMAEHHFEPEGTELIPAHDRLSNRPISAVASSSNWASGWRSATNSTSR